MLWIPFEKQKLSLQQSISQIKIIICEKCFNYNKVVAKKKKKNENGSDENKHSQYTCLLCNLTIGL